MTQSGRGTFLTSLRFSVTRHILILMKKLLFVLFAIPGVTLAGQAFASTTPCDLSQQYKAFTSAVQNSYNPQGDIQRVIKEELSARASLLGTTIDCARADVVDLKDQVLSDDNNSAKQAKDRLVGSLNEAIHFYDAKKDSIRDLGIQGTKDLAKEIKTWRDGNYDQLAGRVKNFLLWSSNQPLFYKASDRLSQSQIVVTSLKLLNNEDSQKVYYDAKSGLENAQNLNDKVGRAIADNISSEEVFQMIKDSLNALSDTYKNFLEISGKLNTSPAPEEGTSTSTNSE